MLKGQKELDEWIDNHCANSDEFERIEDERVRQFEEEEILLWQEL